MRLKALKHQKFRAVTEAELDAHAKLKQKKPNQIPYHSRRQRWQDRWQSVTGKRPAIEGRMTFT
jgi:hypothetical protein